MISTRTAEADLAYYRIGQFCSLGTTRRRATIKAWDFEAKKASSPTIDVMFVG
jgi:hypothetical protein